MVKLALCGLLLLLAGCRQADSQQLVFALATAPAVLDPRLATDAASDRVNALLYDRLIRLDSQGRPRAQMADWQALSATRYRLTLDPGRRAFSDGRLPDANDVAATYQKVLQADFGSPHAGGLAHVTGIHVVDDVRVDFMLSRADPSFPGRLTVGIVPAGLARKADFSRHPEGSGTFDFVAWREDGGLNLRRRRDGQIVAFVPVPDPTMRALKLIRGEAQLLQNDLPAEIVDFLAKKDALSQVERPGTSFAYIGFNLADPLLGRREIRQAIAHAIDREAIIRYLFAGRATPAESVLRPEHWAGSTQLEAFIHDPDRARKLLQSQGYSPSHPLNISYKTSTDPFRVRIAHVLQSQLAQVGINLEIASYDWGTFFGDVKAGRFQMYSLAWVGVNTPDILRYAFHSESLPPSGANRGHYRSTVVDTLIDQAEQLPAQQARDKYRQIQQIIHDELVYVPLWYESNVVVSRDVKHYEPGHDGNYLALNRVEFDDAK